MDEKEAVISVYHTKILKERVEEAVIEHNNAKEVFRIHREEKFTGAGSDYIKGIFSLIKGDKDLHDEMKKISQLNSEKKRKPSC